VVRTFPLLSREEKATAQALEYNKAHKEVRQSVRKDRRTYIENFAAQAEEAANMRRVSSHVLFIMSCIWLHLSSILSSSSSI
jgi:dihydroneopterin aldolase